MVGWGLINKYYYLPGSQEAKDKHEISRMFWLLTLPAHYDYFGLDAATQQILRVVATMTAVFIWSLSLWFFCIAFLACIVAHKQMSFHLNWWAFVFPNVGFTIATINIGKQFRSQGILWVGSIMTILLVATYLFVGVCHIRAVWRKDILWPEKDEDTYFQERKLKHEDKVKMGQGV